MADDRGNFGRNIENEIQTAQLLPIEREDGEVGINIANGANLDEAENDSEFKFVSQSLPAGSNVYEDSDEENSEKDAANQNGDSENVNKNSELDCLNGVTVNIRGAGFEKDGDCNAVVKNGADFVASWDVAGTSGTRFKNRKNVRSRSWCAQRPGDDSITGADIRLLRERLLRTQALPKPAAIKNFSRKQRLTLASLALVDFMSFCSMSIMAPFFPREAGEKGMTESVSGFVFSFYALVMFITSPFFGKILPVVGVKFLFMSGMFVAGSCNLLFGVLEYIYDYELFTLFCFLIRGLEALGASAYSTASYVYVVNTFPNNIGSVLGILETFVGLGMSVGPAIGGLLYSIGGFGLPFYVLGVAMVVTMPINFYLLPSQEDCSLSTKSGSLLELVKVPAVVITSLVIVVVSNTWAFLDPTLEPHLRQFGLSPEQVGLIFLLFSGLYGLSSPMWGWLADRVNRHWCMMVWGLLFCTLGLLLLGPSPLLPFLKSSLWLNLVALSIIGISVALTLLPTFQGVLTSSIEEGGCSDNLATYSVVAGVWSCMYSLGEVIGPSLGGVLLKHYGFPMCSTVMAALTFILAIVTMSFFTLKESSKLNSASDTFSDNPSDNNWISSGHVSDDSGVARFLSGNDSDEHRPLLSSGVDDTNKLSSQNKRISHSYGGMDSVRKLGNEFNHTEPYSNSSISKKDTFKLRNLFGTNDDRETEVNKKPETVTIDGLNSQIRKDYRKYLDGSETESEGLIGKLLPFKRKNSQTKKNRFVDDCGNLGEVSYKRDDKGLLPKFCDTLLSKHMSEDTHSRKNSLDLLKYNMNKVKYYGQSRKDDCEDLVLDRDQVTDVRGTVNLTSSGACEV